MNWVNSGKFVEPGLCSSQDCSAITPFKYDDGIRLLVIPRYPRHTAFQTHRGQTHEMWTDRFYIYNAGLNCGDKKVVQCYIIKGNVPSTPKLLTTCRTTAIQL